MSNSAFTPAVLTIPAAATTATGELNVISNPSAASLSTTGWTGVTAVGTNSPLNPTVTTAFSIANTAGAESSTSGGYASFTMPSGLQNKKLKVEFYFTTPATDVYKVSVYKGGSRVTLTTDSSGSTTLPASTTGKFVAYFDTDTTANWTVNITRTSGSTGPIYVTNVIVGPGIQPQGAVVGEWQSYTGTVANGGTATFAYVSRLWRRVGDSIEIKYGFSVTANGSGSSIVKVPMPSNLTVDLSSMSNETAVGFYSKYNGTQYVAGAAMRTVTATTDGVAFQEVGTGDSIFGSDLVNGHSYFINFTVKVSEWASSGTVQLAQNDVEWASNSSTTDAADTTSFAYGPAGSTGVLQTTVLTAQRLKRVRFQTPIQISDVLTIEVQTNTSPNSWIPLTSSPYSLNYTEQNTASYGLAIRQVSGSSTDVDIAFGRYIYANGTTFAAAGVEWNNASAVGLRAWRVRKSSAGAAVGFGIVQPGVSSGLVSASGVPGNTTGNAIAAGYVGQVLESTQTLSNLTSGNYTTLNLSLGAGIWLITGMINYKRNAATITGLSYNAQIVPNGSGNPSDELYFSIQDSSFSSTYTYLSFQAPATVVRCDGTNIVVPGFTSQATTSIQLRFYAGTFTGGPVQATALVRGIRIA